MDENSNDVTAFLAKQAVKATTKLKIRAIITDSYSGRTARNLAAFRGKYPVLAICYKEKTMRHLALSYGVEAIYMPNLPMGRNIISLLFADCFKRDVCSLLIWWAT